ncbi:MAG: tRNA (adenosine(37)-N6)-threonylcarbamoyltransferase complex ATPase subunit type 1 TsaE [bacterium]|nr:tRNA (adenosine(37)-N6)-threonylcarbamoyltransferase complex ATPase subunit type 1 TsaE [bacterium]
MIIASGEQMKELGRRLAAHLRPGDLILLTGGLGAGKTTLTQGIGAGLGVTGHVASPTFIIARTHTNPTGGPGLVHVDAYRLGSLDELDALDLDTSLEEAVTVVEWGEGLAEVLSEDRLEITITRPHGGLAEGEMDVVDDAERTVTLTGHGERWQELPELDP